MLSLSTLPTLWDQTTVRRILERSRSTPKRIGDANVQAPQWCKLCNDRAIVHVQAWLISDVCTTHCARHAIPTWISEERGHDDTAILKVMCKRACDDRQSSMPKNICWFVVVHRNWRTSAETKRCSILKWEDRRTRLSVSRPKQNPASQGQEPKGPKPLKKYYNKALLSPKHTHFVNNVLWGFGRKCFIMVFKSCCSGVSVLCQKKSSEFTLTTPHAKSPIATQRPLENIGIKVMMFDILSAGFSTWHVMNNCLTNRVRIWRSWAHKHQAILRILNANHEDTWWCLKRPLSQDIKTIFE